MIWAEPNLRRGSHRPPESALCESEPHAALQAPEIPKILMASWSAYTPAVRQEVLDAMRREPDTGFAIHDAPCRIEELLDKQSELRFLLRQRPPDVRPAIRQAELALQYAQKQLSVYVPLGL